LVLSEKTRNKVAAKTKELSAFCIASLPPSWQPSRAKTSGCFSGILLPVRGRFFSATLLIAIAMALLLAAWSGQAQQPAPPPPPAPAAPPQGAPAPAPVAPAQGSAGLSVVVLDPAHGGADAGARGASGVLESEVVLSLARAVRAELERQGLRVLLTRQGNENPSFDERSAVANGQRGALFISLHVSSTGPVGTVRAYSFMAPPRQQTRSAPANPAAPTSLVSWDQAQESHADSSRRLAELVQVQLAQKFRGSPEVPTAAAVRQLRTVAAPAVAIEVSSVSVRDRKQLEQMAPTLAEAVSRAVAAFRLVYEKGAK